MNKEPKDLVEIRLQTIEKIPEVFMQPSQKNYLTNLTWLNFTLFQMLSATSIKSIKTQYLLKIILHTHTQNRLTMFVSCLQLKLLVSNKSQWLCSPNTLWFQFHYAVASWAIPWAIMHLPLLITENGRVGKSEAKS